MQAPLPAPTWEQTRDAIDSGIMCPQANLGEIDLGLNRNKDENCLLASVFTPDSVVKGLPVVVYVHGGAFQVGYGFWLKPINLVKEHDIIAVTFNYRLGVHGFLCLGTEDIPGNAGMKDQVALLRWVKKNIANFGGNPDDVTIAGYSAGSAAVDLLMVSEAAQGLFNKVIPESGANTAAFAIQSDPLKNAKWFAKLLQFNDVDDVEALEQFYKTLSYEQMMFDSFIDKTDSTFVFSPCIERSFPGIDTAKSKEVFLDESPIDIMKKGKFRKVPLLYGFANMEGLLRIPFFDLWKEKMNEKFSDFLPADLKFNNEVEKEKIAKVVKEFYFGKKAIDNDSVLAYVDYFSDVIFAYPTLRAVKLHIEDGHDQIYLYEYSIVDEGTPKVPYTNIQGATHCAQTMAVFGTKIFEFNSSETEQFKNMSSLIRKIWANFIKTGYVLTYNLIIYPNIIYNLN